MLKCHNKDFNQQIKRNWRFRVLLEGMGHGAGSMGHVPKGRRSLTIHLLADVRAGLTSGGVSVRRAKDKWHGVWDEREGATLRRSD